MGNRNHTFFFTKVYLFFSRTILKSSAVAQTCFFRFTIAPHLYWFCKANWVLNTTHTWISGQLAKTSLSCLQPSFSHDSAHSEIIEQWKICPLNSRNARWLQMKFYILINTWTPGMHLSVLAVQRCPSSLKHNCTSQDISFHGTGQQKPTATRLWCQWATLQSR